MNLKCDEPMNLKCDEPMNLKCDRRGRPKMKLARGILGVVVALALSGSSGWAQTTSAVSADKGAAASAADAAPATPGSGSVQTFYLTNVSQASDAIELTTALRNLLDAHDKIYLVPSQNAIFVQGSPEQIVLARKLLNDLDRPKKTYRLTYKITEMDEGKRVGLQRFAMVVVTGQRTILKQGSKVPVWTGSYEAGSSSAKSQFTYLDVGLNFDATLDEFANGVRLRSKVEQSSIAEEKSGVGVQDPIVRQTVMEGTSFLTPGKPLVLGSLDITGSTRHLDVEVVMEQVVQ
jgi:type II secretory pathway component GspD/PulD (secretin)